MIRGKLTYLLAGILLIAILSVPVLVLKKGLPSQTIAIAPKDSKSKGPEKAPVEIVEYSDFQCPSCQQVEQPLAEVLEKYPSQIHFIFRHFPLRSHPQSPLAHQAAECANEQGYFWPFHDRLYQEQLAWTSALNPAEILLGYARELRLDLNRFVNCLQSPDTARKIRIDLIAGQSNGVESTPTFFINGKILVGSKQFKEQADKLIQEELAKAKVGTRVGNQDRPSIP